MKKVFEMPSIVLESFQTNETVMTGEVDPLAVMSIGIDFYWENA